MPDKLEEEHEREKGLSPFRGLINGFIAIFFMYSGVFLLIRWLKRFF